MVFIFVASAFFATANGAIPALAVYEDATQALAQLFTLGAGSLSIAFVAYSIMANQDFSSLIYGGVRSRAAEKEMKAELGEEVSEEDEAPSHSGGCGVRLEGDRNASVSRPTP